MRAAATGASLAKGEVKSNALLSAIEENEAHARHAKPGLVAPQFDTMTRLLVHYSCHKSCCDPGLLGYDQRGSRCGATAGLIAVRC